MISGHGVVRAISLPDDAIGARVEALFRSEGKDWSAEVEGRVAVVAGPRMSDDQLVAIAAMDAVSGVLDIRFLPDRPG
jgi:hypothetical protein